MNVREYNQKAWDKEVEQGNEWTVPVSSDLIAAARQDQWTVVLTETKPVPREWFPELKGQDVLCLASGGGQQGPILAAAGANVTVLDNSPHQLRQDRSVAEREGLALRTIEGDMADLSMFSAESFGLVFHPCSNLFVPEVRPVWREAYRVLRPGGVLLAGFLNPVLFIFDYDLSERGVLQVRHALPYSDLTSLSEAETEQLLEKGEPLTFGHTLEEQIGGQLEAGFVITGFYEDRHQEEAIARYTATYLVTRAIKPQAVLKI
jgi:SAM-dependent methyltransferase